MPKIVTATELQKKTREIIGWTRTKREPVVVESDGTPIAAILSYREYLLYLRYKQARFERFARLRRVAAENTAAGRLAEEEALALVDEIRREVYDDGQQGS